MSLYNMMSGFNQSCFFILPMLGKHPDEYPRFRDCFCEDEEYPEYKDHIHIYTRTGGGNRSDYLKENQAMRNMSGFVIDFDDSYDPTYASWVFETPEKWQKDYAVLCKGENTISSEYLEQIIKVYPKLSDKMRELFGKKKSP